MNNNIITNTNINYDYTLFVGTRVLRKLAPSSNQVPHLKPELSYIDKYSTSNTACTKTIAQLGDAAPEADPNMQNGHLKIHIKNSADGPDL